MQKSIVNIKDLPDNYKEKRASLYKCYPSVPYEYNWDEAGNEYNSLTEYVVIAAVPSFLGYGPPETLVFPADKSGNILNWIEIIGRKHTMSHDELIEAMDYILVDRLF